MPASAPTYNNYSSPVDTVTTQQFMRGEFENVKKYNPILAALEARGNIKAEASGKSFERNARVGIYTSAARSDLAERNFARKQQRVVYAVPYAWYETTGALGDQDITYNTGKEALVKLNGVMVKNMGEDMRRQFSSDLLRSNGGSYLILGQSVAATSPVPIYGLPTIFGVGGLAAAGLAYSPNTQTVQTGVMTAVDKECTPNQSYCGISTHPTNAIAGVDGKLNESTSPVICNWSSTAWYNSGTTFAGNCLYVMEHLQTRLTRSQDPMDQPDMFTMTRSMFTDFTKAIISGATGVAARVVFGQGPTDPNAKVFSKNMVPYGNMQGYWDEYMPTDTLYMLNTNHMEFNYFPVPSLNISADLSQDKGETGEMFGVKTAYDIRQGGHLAVAIMSGQLWANPRFQGCAFNFA